MTITTEQILFGALFCYHQLDEVSLLLLIKQLEKENNIIFQFDDAYLKYLSIHKDGSITLQKKMIDEKIKKELEDMVGEHLISYMKKKKQKRQKKKKKQALSSQRENILKNCKILLISWEDRDYQNLKRYGFQKITYFRSLLAANQYFQQEGHNLKDYHIVIEGKKESYPFFFGICDLEYQLMERKKSDHDVFSLNCYDHSNQQDIVYDVFYDVIDSYCQLESTNYLSLFDQIVKKAYSKGIGEEVPLPKQRKRKKRFPKNQKDIKVLFLDSSFDENLILKDRNITIKEDRTMALNQYVKNNLGRYDIILASKNFSFPLLTLEKESREQCYFTGQRFTLLAIYQIEEIEDTNLLGESSVLGHKIKLTYTSSIKAQENKRKTKEFSILGTKEDCKKAMIDIVRHFYQKEQERLTKEEKDQIYIDYNKAFFEKVEEDKKRLEQELEDIRQFEQFENTISTYLKYRQEGLIKREGKDFQIREEQNGISIEQKQSGKTISRIVLSKKKKEYIKVFSLSSILLEEKILGLYPSEYQKESFPERPNEEERKLLFQMIKKVDSIIKPMNEKIEAKQKIKRIAK